jgi:hypothetical protein
MKRALGLLVLFSGALTYFAACGSGEGNYDPSPTQKVQECIARGGIPSFTQYEGGGVAQYLGCTNG